MKTELIKQQRELAENNSSKKVTELVVGDFVYLYEVHTKNCGGLLSKFVGEVMSEKKYLSRTFCRIEMIVNCTKEQLLKQEFEFGNGGTDSDCIESSDNFNEFNPKREQIDTFYQEVTLIIADDGRYLFVDAEGYNYPRYILFWSDWETMFAPEIKVYLEGRKKMQDEADEIKRKHILEIQDKARKDFGYLDTTKSTLLNLKRILQDKFPSASFNVFLKRRMINVSGADHVEVRDYIMHLWREYSYESFERYSDDYDRFNYKNALEEMIGMCYFRILSIYQR